MPILLVINLPQASDSVVRTLLWRVFVRLGSKRPARDKNNCSFKHERVATVAWRDQAEWRQRCVLHTIRCIVFVAPLLALRRFS